MFNLQTEGSTEMTSTHTQDRHDKPTTVEL